MQFLKNKFGLHDILRHLNPTLKCFYFHQEIKKSNVVSIYILGYCTRLDYFLGTKQLITFCQNCFIIDEVLFDSDHKPIVLEINCSDGCFPTISQNQLSQKISARRKLKKIDHKQWVDKFQPAIAKVFENAQELDFRTPSDIDSNAAFFQTTILQNATSFIGWNNNNTFHEIAPLQNKTYGIFKRVRKSFRKIFKNLLWEVIQGKNTVNRNQKTKFGKTCPCLLRSNKTNTHLSFVTQLLKQLVQSTILCKKYHPK